MRARPAGMSASKQTQRGWMSGASLSVPSDCPPIRRERPEGQLLLAVQPEHGDFFVSLAGRAPFRSQLNELAS